MTPTPPRGSSGVSWEIRQGDALDRLREMPDESVQCCVTSPPYFGLRDYGVDGQIGQEATPDEFVAALVEVFREVRRVLRSDGTLWLNLGDSYWTAKGMPGGARAQHQDAKNEARRFGVRPTDRPPPPGLKRKDLVGIPWRVAPALQADGWYLRCDVVWEKPNRVPEPTARDRPSRNHEYLFLLAKSDRYFYDDLAVREDSDPDQEAHNQRYAKVYDAHSQGTVPNGVPGNSNNLGIHSRPGPGGRPKRSVWHVSTVPFPDEHFATFPPKLIDPCILASTSAHGVCDCGGPWQRVVESNRYRGDGEPVSGRIYAGRERTNTATGRRHDEWTDHRTVSWRATCSCAEPTSTNGHGIVLDPFAGAGTTGMVALRHGRSFLGVELNPAYVEIARRRIVADAPLLNQPAEVAA